MPELRLCRRYPGDYADRGIDVDDQRQRWDSAIGCAAGATGLAVFGLFGANPTYAQSTRYST